MIGPLELLEKRLAKKKQKLSRMEINREKMNISREEFMRNNEATLAAKCWQYMLTETQEITTLRFSIMAYEAAIDILKEHDK